jgi:hypothetical protein
MGDSDLEIQFGASTGEVEAGAERVKAAIEGLSEVAKTMGEALGVAFGSAARRMARA